MVFFLYIKRQLINNNDENIIEKLFISFETFTPTIKMLQNNTTNTLLFVCYSYYYYC